MSDAEAPGAPASPASARLPRLATICGVLAVLYAAAIFWASSRSTPFPFMPTPVLGADKLLHAGGYALLGFLVRVAVAARVRDGRRAFLAAVVIAALYGATDEWHQHHVPNRQADPWDWAADAVGAVGGAALAAGFLRRRGGAG